MVAARFLKNSRYIPIPAKGSESHFRLTHSFLCICRHLTLIVEITYQNYAARPVKGKQFVNSDTILVFQHC